MRSRLQRLLVSKTETVILMELGRAAVYWIDVSLKVHQVRMSLLITYRYTTLNTRIKQTSVFISFVDVSELNARSVVSSLRTCTYAPRQDHHEEVTL